MNNNKIAIIDIDNTLWDLATVLYKRLYNKFGSIVPLHSEWHDWSFWKNFCDPETFYYTVKEIHLEQDRFVFIQMQGSFCKKLNLWDFRL